ncbi:MAG TPA: CPBP family intramembrane glutamic endopeptidase, partial [Candidatus Limnocylindrales bacterium]|nr:CPBP family intramembrane glutamic endopeptidase [Candidatus Limnocylindrales bacterium]
QAAGRTVGSARAMAEEGISRATAVPAGVAETIASLAHLVRRTERPDRAIEPILAELRHAAELAGRAVGAAPPPPSRRLLRRRGRGDIGAARLALGMAGAQAAFAAIFRGPRERFWDRMTLTGLLLGGYALASSPAARRVRIRPRDVIAGLVSAAVLYATFRIGDRFARRFVPGAEAEISDIYRLGELRPTTELALRLATIIGPAEELFWRGFVQQALMERVGRWPGAALAAAAYGGVHVVTGNFTLFGAAGVAGLHWCALYAAGVPLGALIVSHSAWDVWIFLLRPTVERPAG